MFGKEPYDPMFDLNGDGEIDRDEKMLEEEYFYNQCIPPEERDPFIVGLYAGIGLEDGPEESEDELSSNDLDSDCDDFDNDDCDDWGDDGADD